MDNLTHTLVGLAAGELVARTTRPQAGGLPQTTRRTALLVIGMIGGNLPDSDLLWSMGGDRLGYELQHRGYTHTIAGCVVLAVVLYVATLLCLRWRQHHPVKQEHALLGAMSSFSVLLHLGMDALNSYGVHPFWPIDNRWYYGDSVFIVEPLYWLAAAPLLFVMQTLSPRILLGLILLIGNVAILVVHRFALAWLLVPLSTLLLVWLGGRRPPLYAALASVMLMAGVTAGFVVAGNVATNRVNAAVQEKFPGYHTLDLVLTPTPAQPLCWDVVVLQRMDDLYVAHTGRLALTGNHSAAVCPQLGTAPAADQVDVRDSEQASMLWGVDYTMSIAQFNALVAADCRAQESLQFVRAPFLTQTGNDRVLGDLRFGGNDNRGLGAVLLRADAPNDCRVRVPWTPPRSDLLTTGQ